MVGCCSAARLGPGSMHDLTQARTAGLVDLLLHAPLGVQVLADAGYQGLGTDTAGVVITPKPKPRKHQKSLPPSVIAAHDAARKRHSSQRIRVEHVIGHLKNWRILARFHGRREHFDATVRAIAGLLSDHQHTTTQGPTSRTPPPMKRLSTTAIIDVQEFASVHEVVRIKILAMVPPPARLPTAVHPTTQCVAPSW
ncbi:transposase family protein [Micromonospora sp. WMMD737]|uniref:transposase family protein n=1 Tax=Micromonospora sp. WMMD737 TaxID=3404113 RepID=UPI003B9260B5